ncbi:MAG TPA: double-strand break repair helicase AddA [Devosia sp.]
MTRRLKDPMPADIISAQRAASDPGQSVWVGANAGSGKTYVLTARVLRLLLSGVKPEEILCLTYTKAAAAEMRGRVAERLGKWALAPEAELMADLTALGGTPPTPAMQLRARSLFAHALETPGGLRIQTIHAFCESVLHRFPREAGVPFDFSVLEEHERDGMLLEAREMVLAAGLRGGGEAQAVETLFGLLSDFSIEQAIIEALNQQRILRRVLSDVPRAKRELRKLVGPVGSIDEVLDEMSTGYGLSREDHATILRIVPAGTSEFVDRLSQVDPARPDPDALMDAFLTQTDRTARKTLLKKATAVLIPEIAARLVDEAARLESLYGRLVAAELIARSEAMLDIVAAISAHYERAKRARSLLDFDDLIERLAALLKDEAQGLWVRYKLDAGISHILVDEGQDTNPQQWEVIGALVDDFFFGESAADRPRTIFAVGDQKQSIFSFQGAEPEVFVDAGRQYAFSARAVHTEVRHVPLRFSFRTLPHVLKAVDLVFNNRPDLKEGALEDEGLLHETARAEGGGLVTLWPPIKDVADEVDPNEWPKEPPAVATQSAQRRVAERIAREIKGWTDTRRPLGPRGRAVRADDVLILVQVRSVLFHEIIRALIRAGIPTPGADRLAVTSHIGVLDMMALGDVLSNPADDLQLAALLRSPLFEVSEDDLLAVAQPRGENERLWWAMEKSAIPSVRAAYEQLSAWRSRLDFDRPFNFYADVLYGGGGLRRLRGRFGSEIDDVMAEFLDLALAHEQSEQPSLLGFLAELRSREVTIKRELAEGGAGVRVMTVHGAKGLEAPIVILADAATTERGRDRRAVYLRPNPPLFIHASSEATHVEETREYKAIADAAQQAEYWRKLYVAMTRAEDELYVTGYLTKQGKPDGSWYEAIAQGLAAESERVTDAEGNPTALIYPAEREAAAPAQPDPEESMAVRQALILAPLPEQRPIRVVRPSAVDISAPPERALATRLEESFDADTARKRGIAIHALLQHLGRVPFAARGRVAQSALASLLPEAPELHGDIAKKALSILDRLELSFLFGPNSRAEVPFFANAERNGKPIRLAGRFDRLVVEPDRVLVVDFKSDANVPTDFADVPSAYLTQLGLYALVASQLFPRHRVEAAILWTSLESLLELPGDVLAKATLGFTMR